jgi:superfamily II DNA or RNA helicase
MTGTLLQGASPIALLGHQEVSLFDLRAAIKEYQSVLFRGETGSGKTVMASEIALGAQRKGKKIIFGVHRIELAIQAARTFARFGIRYGFIGADFPYDPFASVYIAIAGTLANRRQHLHCDLFVVDEAHLWASDIRAEMLLEVLQNGGKVIGLTATPERLDGRSLRPLFHHMVEGPSTRWLIENGYRSDYRLFAPTWDNVDSLRKHGNDYSIQEMEQKFDKPSIFGDAIKTYKRLAMGKPMMAFSFSRKHGQHLRDAYLANGIHAVYVDGNTHKTERRDAIIRFADHGGVIVGVQLFVEGVDIPALIGRDVPIEAVSLQCPTASLPRARQMIGRARGNGTDPILLMDHVGIVAQHGLPDEERAWSLDGREARQNAEGEKAISTFRCSTCFYTQRSPFRKCPDCQTPVPISEGRKVEVEEGDLAEVDLEAVRRAQRNDLLRRQGMSKDLPSLAKFAVDTGKNPGWVRHILKARGEAVPEWHDVERAMREARN